MSKVLDIHKRLKGKIAIKPKIKVSSKNIGLIYTPGVVEATKAIAKDSKKVFDYTACGNNVAIITDGSRTLGVGDAIPEASLPVMEGKALFLNSFSGIDAYPFCLKTKLKEEIIRTIEILSPNFSAFNLEDVQAPKSLEIMEELRKKDLIIFHDDEQGVAIAVLAALLNGLKVVEKRMEKIKICIGGAGSAGYGIFKLLNYAGIKDMVVFDSKGIIYSGRAGDNRFIKEIADNTNPENLRGGKEEALKGRDVFIGVTGVANLLNKKDIALMAENPIIFAISNPIPEIVPGEIKKSAQKFIFASGRSDYPNQINNIIVFPGVFRGLVDFRKKMDLSLELKIAKSIAALVKMPNSSNIIPDPFNKKLVKTIAKCIKNH